MLTKSYRPTSIVTIPRCPFEVFHLLRDCNPTIIISQDSLEEMISVRTSLQSARAVTNPQILDKIVLA